MERSIFVLGFLGFLFLLIVIEIFLESSEICYDYRMKEDKFFIMLMMFEVILNMVVVKLVKENLVK